jgi:hypothetical protein
VERGTPVSIEVTRLFAPYAILPVQIVHPPADHWLQRLYVAILGDALRCLEGKGPPSHLGSRRDGARRWHEAWQWVLSDAESCFSFATVCSVLQLDMRAVRQQLTHRFALPRPWLRWPRQRPVSPDVG